MSVEEVIKQETEKTVNKYKSSLLVNNYKMTSMEEALFRTGISYGISIASIALSSLPVDITLVTGD